MKREMIMMGPNDSSIDIMVPSSTSVNTVGVMNRPDNTVDKFIAGI